MRGRVVAIAIALATLVMAPQASANLLGKVDSLVDKTVGRQTAIVHVDPDSTLAQARTAASRLGLELGFSATAIDAFVARGTGSVFEALARTGLVERIEADRELQYFTNTSHRATRGQAVLDGAVTLPGGGRIDGTGVGVAVVDSGVDGTHPDLRSRMASNVKLLPLLGTPVPVPDSDTPSLGGHGTHVAGIVAGTGAASGGTYHGAAPDARLHGIGAGTAILVSEALQGLQWAYDNRGQGIRVVNNSWGDSGGAYDPNDAISQMVNQLVGAGVTVVFAAGNAGGDGSAQTTSSQCVIPTPGVICVANYDDQNTGTRSGPLNPSSSRGRAGAPESYPDISAPGTDIVSTCRITLPICHLGGGVLPTPLNSYASLSGTSMAAPHIAGITAQLLEANPGLSPAQVENTLQDTALKFTFGAPYEPDPQNPDGTTSFDKGAGLVDVVAALGGA